MSASLNAIYPKMQKPQMGKVRLFVPAWGGRPRGTRVGPGVLEQCTIYVHVLQTFRTFNIRW